MKRIRLSLLLAFLILSPLLVLGQPGGDPTDGNPTVPITGIEYLLGGGLILGFRRLLAKKKT